MRREERGEFFRPLDDADAVAEKVFVEPDAERRVGVVEAVEVEVVKREPPAGVFVDERESGAGHADRRAESGGETFDEVRLARAEFAAEREDVAAPERGGDGLAVGDRFFSAGGNDRRHQGFQISDF